MAGGTAVPSAIVALRWRTCSSGRPASRVGRRPRSESRAALGLAAMNLASGPRPSAIVPTAVETSGLADTLGRPLHDLRISVTDRCNFRCTYCMPKEVFGPDFAFLPRADVLTFEEIAQVSRVFVGLGVEKLRLTGAEPLVRRDLPVLVAMLAAIRRPDGAPLDLTLTTNGSTLRRHAGPLAEAGLRRVTVSLDSLDDEVFGAMNGIEFPVARVLDGIAAAAEAGLGPIQIHLVVRRGLNEASILVMARWAREERLILRFIEYMDVGHTTGWRLDD